MQLPVPVLEITGSHGLLCFIDKKFLEFFFKRVKHNNSGKYEADFPYVSPCGREMNYIRCDDLPTVFTQLLDQNKQVIQDIGKYGQCESTVPESVLVGSSSTGSTLSQERCSAVENQTSAPSPSPCECSAGKTLENQTRDPLKIQSTDPCKNSLEGSEWLSYGGAGELLTVPFQPNKLCMLPGGGRVYHIGLEKLGGVALVKSSLAFELSRFFVYEQGADDNSPPSKFTWRGRTWDLDESVLRNVMKFTKQLK